MVTASEETPSHEGVGSVGQGQGHTAVDRAPGKTSQRRPRLSGVKGSEGFLFVCLYMYEFASRE